MAIYRDPIIELIIAKLNAEGPSQLQNKYFTGDPLIVGKSELPAGFITRDKTSFSDFDIANDRHDMAMVLNVVQDTTKDFNQTFDMRGSTATLYDWVEGRQENYTLKPTALTYILRKYQQNGPQTNGLAPKLWINMGTPIEADYGVTLNKRGAGIFAVEAVIRFVVTSYEPWPGAPSS